MRISDASHHLKKTSLWDYGNQADAEDVLTTPDILHKATATIRASLGVNSPESMWRAVGQHLQKQLLQLKAVNITNFGAFGFDQNNDFVFVQDPVFVHMTRLCLASRKRGNIVAPALRQNGQVVDIDVEGLAAEYLQNCSKDLVKSVISSVLAWVTSWAKDGQQMRLSFLPVGEWICDGESLDFRFSESFREDIALMKVVKDEQEEGIAEIVGGGDNMNNNQFDEHGQELFGGQATGSPRSALNAAATEKVNHNPADDNAKADIFSSAAKVAAVQSGSSVERSRYKLRAPTVSSIAKQLPPHGQRRKKRADNSVKGISSNNKVDMASKRKVSTCCGVSCAAEQVNSASPIPNRFGVDAATEGILAAVKNIRPGTSSSVRPCKSISHSKTTPSPTAQQVDTISRLLKRLSNRRSQAMQGLNALVAVLRPFKIGAISPTELSLALRKLGVKVSSSELKDIAATFSHEKRGYIDITKFLDYLRGPPLSGARLDLVAKAFYQMAPAGSGVVNVDDMIKHYDVGFLPQVRDGRQSKLEALTAFLQEWSAICTSSGNTVAFEAFVKYYQNVSACIGNDSDFERLMRQAWRLPEEGPGPESESPSGSNAKNSTSSVSPGVSINLSPQSGAVPVAVTGAETVVENDTRPSKAWAYLRALLLFPQPYQVGVSSWPTLDNMCRRLGANRVLGDGNEAMNVKAFAHSLNIMDKRLTHDDAYDLSCFVADHCAVSLDDRDTIVLSSLYRMLTTNWSEKATSYSTVDYNYVEYYASRAIERIRMRINGHQTGANLAKTLPPVNLNVLTKWLQASSSNGDSLLMKYELRSALMKVGIDITYQDLDYLFAYFDINRQGYINYEAFLEALRSPSSMLPKLAKSQENLSTHSDVKLLDDASLQEPTRLIYMATPQPAISRRKQVSAREPQPNYRRRNLIHRAIWDQSVKGEVATTNDTFDKLELERRLRYRAAQLIQTTFRAFRARQIAAQLRRKAAATIYRSNTLVQERLVLLARKKKMNRTSLPTAYGF